MKALTAAEMREVDRLTTERFGISGLQLMEWPGSGSARRSCDGLSGGALRRNRGGIGASRFCAGKGNNGGDGLVAARHLRSRGLTKSLCFWGPAKFKGDASENFQRWRDGGGSRECGGRTKATGKSAGGSDASSDVIVDALLGTGLRGAVTGSQRKAISAVNEFSRNATAARPSLIISVDMPSGLPSDGEAAEGPVLRRTKR